MPPGKLKKSMWVQAVRNTKGIVLDQKTLEALFYVQQGKEKPEEKTQTNSKQVNILDLQRANNVGKRFTQVWESPIIIYVVHKIGILLSRFRGSNADLKKAILNFDEKVSPNR